MFSKKRDLNFSQGYHLNLKSIYHCATTLFSFPPERTFHPISIRCVAALPTSPTVTTLSLILKIESPINPLLSNKIPFGLPLIYKMASESAPGYHSFHFKGSAIRLITSCLVLLISVALEIRICDGIKSEIVVTNRNKNIKLSIANLITRINSKVKIDCGLLTDHSHLKTL